MSEKWKFLIVHQRDAQPPEVLMFSEEKTALEFYDRMRLNWSEVYYTKILAGPPDAVDAPIEPPNQAMYDELREIAGLVRLRASSEEARLTAPEKMLGKKLENNGAEFLRVISTRLEKMLSSVFKDVPR